MHAPSLKRRVITTEHIITSVTATTRIDKATEEIKDEKTNSEEMSFA